MPGKDEQLVSAYLAGDEDAFRELVERHLKPVFNFVRRLVGTEAEDVTQEVFIKVWKNLGSYRDGASFKPWLYSIARNTGVTWLRKKRHLSMADLGGDGDDGTLADSLADPGPLPDELAATEELGRLLEDAVSRLPEHFRMVISLRRDAELTFEEIGLALDKPADTVKSHYRRAVAALKKSLTDSRKTGD